MEDMGEFGWLQPPKSRVCQVTMGCQRRAIGARRPSMKKCASFFGFFYLLNIDELARWRHNLVSQTNVLKKPMPRTARPNAAALDEAANWQVTQFGHHGESEAQGQKGPLQLVNRHFWLHPHPNGCSVDLNTVGNCHFVLS